MLQNKPSRLTPWPHGADISATVKQTEQFTWLDPDSQANQMRQDDIANRASQLFKTEWYELVQIINSVDKRIGVAKTVNTHKRWN